MKVRGKDGRVLADMYHMKEPGPLDAAGCRSTASASRVDGFHGGRDRTFGVRVADEIDFWLWLDAGFDDRAIEAWVFESADGTVNYVDGGITYDDGTLSKRFVKIEHDVEFDGDRKRPARAVLVFTDEDGADLPRHRRRAASGRQRLLRAADGALPVRGPRRRCVLHPLRLGQQRSRPARRDRGQVDGDRPVDALRARRRHRLGHLRDSARRQTATTATPTGRRWTCRRSRRTRPRSTACPQTAKESVMIDAGPDAVNG